MVEVELSRIIIDEAKREQVIVLKERDGARIFPIVIGINEAAAIRMCLSGFIPPRPMTHDLMSACLKALAVILSRVVIDSLEESTFHAKLYLETPEGSERILDARPSDSIALAVRTKSPIFVAAEVFKKVAKNP